MILALPVEIISNILGYTREPRLIKDFIKFLTKKDIQKIVKSRNLANSIQNDNLSTIKGIIENIEKQILYTKILKLAVYNKDPLIFQYLFKKYIQQKIYNGYGYTLFPCIKSILKRDKLDLVLFLYHQDKNIFQPRYIRGLVQELAEQSRAKLFLKKLIFLGDYKQ